jgi:hypothetical protein
MVKSLQGYMGLMTTPTFVASRMTNDEAGSRGEMTIDGSGLANFGLRNGRATQLRIAECGMEERPGTN